MRTHDLRESLDKLFAAFPLHYHSEEALEQRKQQYRLYHDRLCQLPGDLIESTVLELIDTATHMPRIGTIRARVEARIKRRISRASAAPPADHERTREVHSLAETPPIGEKHKQTAPVIGPCPRIRDVDGIRQPCGRPYEYTASQARWLQSQGEKLLCTRCAGEYLAHQGELRRREAIWAENLLARLSTDRRPSPEEVKRLRMYGYSQQLHERLVAIGAHSSRRPH